MTSVLLGQSFKSECTFFRFSLPFCQLDAENGETQRIPGKKTEAWVSGPSVGEASCHAGTEGGIKSYYVNHEKVCGLLVTVANTGSKLIMILP